MFIDKNVFSLLLGHPGNLLWKWNRENTTWLPPPIRVKHRMTKITPENIAYTATRIHCSNTYPLQLHYALSSVSPWGVDDDYFNFNTFFQTVLCLFSIKDDPWVVDTLKYYYNGYGILSTRLHLSVSGSFSVWLMSRVLTVIVVKAKRLQCRV